ncbi:MAG TPA: hypothetical protein VKU41_28140 [Polyangiaceae bacterium]|nr:hypothetical protein [Polyangiaceae bacterium]
MRKTPLFASVVSTSAIVLLIACGGGGGNGSGTPSLESTCTTVCNNVLGQCCNVVGAACGGSSALNNCLQSCQGLSAVEGTCVDQFASYLACLSGATSISCEASGPTITVLSPSCNTQFQAYGQCTGGPSPVSACIGISTPSSPCGTSSAPGTQSLFCVGQPAGCLPAGPGLFGIGPYCCPSPAGK